MLFNSIEFGLFFLIVFVSFYLLRVKYRWILLLVSSYIFYMSWQPFYLLLILASTLIDFVAAQKIYKSNSNTIRIRWLLVSLFTNLGILFSFKYFNFFSSSVASILSGIGYTVKEFKSSLLLPVGISFYTFQTMSYTIDVYRKKLVPESHLGKFALYVTFFPQLVAGPIERAKNLLPQIRVPHAKLAYNNIAQGLTQIIFGLFKKVVVCDSAALYVDSIYNNYELHSGFTLILATYIFAIQIYCDFSGYSDIAIGSARMLGFKLMDNFNIPYFSKNITEFWRRWHISLSSWLRDYLYISLGGNRKGKIFTYRNLMITMLLGGLWHGTSWNFVIWGGLNGLFLAFERLLKVDKFDFNKNVFFKWSSAFVTFNLICLTWVFFRSVDFTQSFQILSQIFIAQDFFNIKILDVSVFANIIIGLAVLLFIEYFFLRKNSLKYYINTNSFVSVAAFNTSLLLLILLFGVSEGSQFIYFQF